jgi:hypothetical protein
MDRKTWSHAKQWDRQTQDIRKLCSGDQSLDDWNAAQVRPFSVYFRGVYVCVTSCMCCVHGIFE